MKAVVIAAAAVLALSAGAASADQALAQKSACMSCHQVAKKVVGPAFKDVAAKYKGDAKAARERYVSAYPDLLSSPVPRVDSGNFYRAIDLALVLQGTGELVRAKALLDGGELAIRPLARLGIGGYWLADVQIHALRGDRAKALIALREAEMAGWRGPFWRYYRDIDPNLESIRDEPEFKAVFADIERDVERQRAELAARPKDAPLDPSPAH